MAIPDVYDLTLPVLRELSDGQAHTTSQMTSALADALHLTKRELQRTRPDGRPLFQNRIEWARTHLKKAGLVEYPEPRVSRITEKGLHLLGCDPRQLGAAFLRAGAVERTSSAVETVAVPARGSLESELRSLIGSPVAGDEEWDIIRRLNGWGADPPATYKRVSADTGKDYHDVLALARSCRTAIPRQAPMLDAALKYLLERPDQDPEMVALTMARLGVTEGAFCVAGLCEAARRFGRFDEWAALIRQLATNGDRRVRPRPFDSWFEVDVFLYIQGLGHRVVPQKRIGNYRVDLLLPDFVPQLVIECDGDRFHGRDRTTADEKREADLLRGGYHLLRFRYSVFQAKPHAIKNGLAEILSRPESVGLQLRAG